jgi:hypothetical protein
MYRSLSQTHAAPRRFVNPRAGALVDPAAMPGAALHDRRRIIAASPDDLAARARILRRLEQALRRERALAGSRTYDLNRHIRLAQALAAERAAMERETQNARPDQGPRAADISMD